MPTPPEQTCLNKLLERVKICCVWDGYDATTDHEQQKKLYKIYSEEMGYGIPLDELSEQVRRCNGIEELDFTVTKQAIDTITKILKAEATHIATKAAHRHVDAEKIPDAYFDQAARKIAAKHTGELLVEVPSHWLPIS